MHALSGQPDKAERILAAVRAEGRVSPYAMAHANTALGHIDEAFAWLDKAYMEHDALLWMLNVDPDLARLRSDGRFAILLKKLHLVP